MTLAAVTCAHCGARVREDRVNCLRCGNPLVAASVHHEQHSARLTSILAVAGTILVVALVGVVAMRPTVPRVSVASKPTAAPVRASLTEASAAPVALIAPPAATAFDAKQIGRAAYAAGDVEKSLAEFEAAIDAQPNDAVALNNLGQVLVKAGRALEAIPYFDRAIAASPEMWAYHFNRARAYAVLRNWSAAIAGYRDALRIFPDDYATQFNLARALEAKRDLAAAIEGYERAIELAPGEASFHLSHGQALEAAKRPQDAVRAYRRYLELAENAPDADKVKKRIADLEGTPAAPAR